MHAISVYPIIRPCNATPPPFPNFGLEWSAHTPPSQLGIQVTCASMLLHHHPPPAPAPPPASQPASRSKEQQQGTAAAGGGGGRQPEGRTTAGRPLSVALHPDILERFSAVCVSRIPGSLLSRGRADRPTVALPPPCLLALHANT